MKVMDIKPLPKDDWGKARAHFRLANAILKNMRGKKIEVSYE